MTSMKKEKRSRSSLERESEEKTQKRHHRQQESESKRQDVRDGIGRLMRTGSVLDPLAESLFNATETGRIVSSVTDLVAAIGKEMDGIELVDPLDACVEVAEAYTHEAGPVESQVTAALEEVKEVERWPPGLMGLVVGFVAGGRNETEWSVVKTEYVASGDEESKREWRHVVNMAYATVYEIKDHGWRAENAHQQFHPLTLLGVWPLGCTIQRHTHALCEWIRKYVRRHRELIKALALVFYLVKRECYGSSPILQLLILQSSRVGVMGSDDTLFMAETVSTLFRNA